MTPATLATLLIAEAEGRPVVLATRLRDGAQTVWPNDALPENVAAVAAAALARDASRDAAIDGERWFFRVQARPCQILVIGAVHIAQAIVPIAAAIGMMVTVIDPRASFNTADRFPETARLVAWPQAALAAIGLGPQTAVIVLAHDPKLDDPALDAALRSDAFFIGALGSRKSHAARLHRLGSLGHGREALARIRGPVGLALGAVSPEEIALSIVAEIVAVRRGSALGIRAQGDLPFP